MNADIPTFIYKAIADACFSLIYLFRSFLNRTGKGINAYRPVQSFSPNGKKSQISSPYWVEQRQFYPAVSSGHQGEWQANT